MLAHDILERLQSAHPDFYRRVVYVIGERSSSLRVVQVWLWGGAGLRVWVGLALLSVLLKHYSETTEIKMQQPLVVISLDLREMPGSDGGCP